MLEVFQPRLIKKPRKTHICECCGERMIGEHLSFFGVDSGDCSYWRTHVECDRKSRIMCSECGDSGWCDMSYTECYSEKEMEKEKETGK